MFNLPKKLLTDYLGEKLVMVIEPSTNYRLSIRQFLTNLHVKSLKLVSNVSEARREMLTTRVGFFIVEWGLEEINGLQFCRELRKDPAYKEVPFLLLSVENLKTDVILASEVTIDGYLLKPFSYEDFCNQIFTIVKNRTTPSRSNTLMDIADERMERGDLEGAEKGFQEALNINNRSARAWTGLAQVEQRRGNLDLAIQHLTKATDINSEYIQAYRVMLDIAEERKDRSGMIRAASVLHSMSPENPRYTLILARMYTELGNLEGSEEFFRKTISLSPRLAEAYKGLGNVYMQQSEYEKAMKNFKKALDIDEKDIGILNALGTAFVRMGELNQGIDRYMIALKLDPHDPRVLFNLGHAFEKKGANDRAESYYSLALTHRPNFSKAQRGLERVRKSSKKDES